MRVLCIGDVVGGVGRRAVAALLPGLVEQRAVDLVIANAENAAGGMGLTCDTADDLLAAGADVLTGGNHLWKFKEIAPRLDSDARLLRPLNYPEGAPGRGYTIRESRSGVPVGVINAQGQAFMEPVGCPFRAVEAALHDLADRARVIVVDFHAEATSEKRALGWFLDGRVSAVVGTHTHVPTADEEVLPGGTGYITDLGMTGPYDSVIGSAKKPIIKRFLTMRPQPFNVAKHDVRLCGALLDIDEDTGRARGVERIRLDHKR
jgi:hypothetical protein